MQIFKIFKNKKIHKIYFIQFSNFSLDFKIYTRMFNQENFMTRTHSLKFENLTNICGLEVNVEYLLKQEIFKLENEYVR
jgi:hypothetical protein